MVRNCNSFTLHAIYENACIWTRTVFERNPVIQNKLVGSHGTNICIEVGYFKGGQRGPEGAQSSRKTPAPQDSVP